MRNDLYMDSLCLHKQCDLNSTSHVFVTYSVIRLIRPTQSMIYVPFQVNRFQKKYFTYRSVQILKILFRKFFSRIWSSAQDHVLLDLLLNIVGLFISAWQKSVRRKCFVPQLYQLRRSISEGPALKYFYMIHRGGRSYGRNASWFAYWFWRRVAGNVGHELDESSISLELNDSDSSTSRRLIASLFVFSWFWRCAYT